MERSILRAEHLAAAAEPDLHEVLGYLNLPPLGAYADAEVRSSRAERGVRAGARGAEPLLRRRERLAALRGGDGSA